MKLIFENNWVGSKPYFYSEETGKHSKNINRVIDSIENPEISEEGLHYYLKYGFSLFGLTPIKGVNFLEANTTLKYTKKNKLKSFRKEDPFYSQQSTLSEDDIFDLFKKKVNDWEDSLPSDSFIILPLSGGYDSRLLLWAVKNKDRLKLFTYGTSPNQSKSFEVVRAKYIASKYNLKVNQIFLNESHKYTDLWIRNFGISTHLHGTYQIEFYKKITELIGNGHYLLSGIVGDILAGSIPYQNIRNSKEVRNLMYTHGLDISKSLLEKNINTKEILFFEKYNKELKKTYFQNLCTIRFKMILLSYLLNVPKIFGLDAWSPFLDLDIGSNMLLLPQKRRDNRLWQYEFFRKKDLFVDNAKAGSMDTYNDLDFQLINKKDINYIQFGIIKNFMKMFIKIKKNDLNIKVNLFNKIQNKLYSFKYLRFFLKKFGFSQPMYRKIATYKIIYPLISIFNQNL